MSVCDKDCQETNWKKKAYQKAYRRANREKMAAYQKAHYKANQKKLSNRQKVIRTFRLTRLMTQAEFAARLGVSESTVSRWERGLLPANWDLLRSVFQENFGGERVKAKEAIKILEGLKEDAERYEAYWADREDHEEDIRACAREAEALRMAIRALEGKKED